MHDWKKLLIASHYHNNRRQKHDFRNSASFANSMLFSKLNNLKTCSIFFFEQVEISSGK